MAGNFPRPFTSPGRTNSSTQLHPAAPFHPINFDIDDQDQVGLTTTTSHPNNQILNPEPPAGSDSLGTTATSAVDQSLPRNLTVFDLPPQQQPSPYIQYLYGALTRGQGYSTTNSARTSYTRVDSMALESENETEQEVPEPEDEHNGENAPQVEQIQAIPPPTPVVSICFLLISGKRKVMTFEPETTVGRVKELLFHSWPTGQDWTDERPPTPSHFRLLHLGRILQDEDTLKACNFPSHTPSTSSSPAPTIVHLAIRPSGPGIPNPRDSSDLEKKNKSTRTRLVARFSSVLANGDGNDAEPTPAPGTGTGTGGTGDAAAAEESSRGCTCCIIC
ncbi:hypothetical protein GYMLUDRAFT_537637 [Collybiopsis luxurians FD-317 M1]|nr:hypothetical protein GYMLUDRAFT_537637 [Collybiopsis luxurians FD-317 M1]